VNTRRKAVAEQFALVLGNERGGGRSEFVSGTRALIHAAFVEKFEAEGGLAHDHPDLRFILLGWGRENGRLFVLTKAGSESEVCDLAAMDWVGCRPYQWLIDLEGPSAESCLRALLNDSADIWRVGGVHGLGISALVVNPRSFLSDTTLNL
jgi:hypothetical protein